MQFSTIILATFAGLALAAPSPAAEANAAPEAVAAAEAAFEKRACAEGTYSCQGNTPSVCQFGIWMVAARCGSNQKCVKASTGGVYCIER